MSPTPFRRQGTKNCLPQGSIGVTGEASAGGQKGKRACASKQSGQSLESVSAFHRLMVNLFRKGLSAPHLARRRPMPSANQAGFTPWLSGGLRVVSCGTELILLISSLLWSSRWLKL